MAWQGEVFQGKIGFTMEESIPHWNLPPRPPEGTPNVLMIVMDDVGYGHLGCYGGESRRRTSTSWPPAACSTPTGIRPPCARPPARVC